MDIETVAAYRDGERADGDKSGVDVVDGATKNGKGAGKRITKVKNS